MSTSSRNKEPVERVLFLSIELNETSTRAVLLFAVVAGLSMYEGMMKILTPHDFKNEMINYIVLGLAFVFKLITW